MPPYLIASDLDSTLLDAEHRVAALTRETLAQLVARGHTLALASGRHHLDIALIRRQLELPAWIISSNGACVFDADDRVVSERPVPPALVEALVALPRPAAVRLNLYTRERWLIDAEAPELLPLHAMTGFTYQVDALRDLSQEAVSKVLYIGEPALLAPLERTLRERYGDALHITYSAANSLEVMQRGVDKGSALAQTLAALAMPASQALAFGDNFNDIEMLTLAGNAFVVANAHPEVIARLPRAERIGAHHEAAVAHTLRRFFALD
ncbi:Cof-type HAD-IIB family hydrolase [Salinicola sp. JS01]|uniref:Cof-type HAD-IIB family hydrolase n=1 Tax=Salinicola sp. JS01 TaxID=3050071 RepID=UPI00255BDDE8|nr:Cof-type HAD-IIB family hydrolase [Salinicola sp. JS01]WIX31453.1 Cof-type HAD-IIB family hydrolase [Salinicola sp. JS01]